MSSPASPRGGEIGEVARQSRRGCPHSRKAAFQQVYQSGNVDSFQTPPPAAPSLSALSRGRGGHCYVSTFNSAQPHICQHHRHINHKPTTLNPKPTTLNAPSPQKAPALPFVCTATQGKTTSAVIPKRSFISPMPETIHSVHAFRLPKDLQAAVSPIGCRSPR